MSDWTGIATAIPAADVTPPLAAYALETARLELKRSLPWLTRTVDHEPLDGLYDGANTAFHLPVAPADPDSALALYDASGTALDGYTVSSYDYGTVVFSSGSIPAATV